MMPAFSCRLGGGGVLGDAGMVAKLVSHRIRLGRARRVAGAEHHFPATGGFWRRAADLIRSWFSVNILWAEGLLGMVETFRKTRTVRASLPFAGALLMVAFMFALGWHHLLRHRGEGMRPALNFACIQPNVPQVVSNDESWQDDALKREVRMSQEAMKTKPDLLIWPEAIIDEGIFQDRPLNEAVHSICEDFGGYFLLGSQDFDIEARKLYNCAYLFAPHGDDYQYYQKTRLVVWGEYLPFGNTFPWFRKWAGMGMDFTAGRAPKKFVLANPKLSFAPLICFEDTLADVPAKAARLNPDFFVTITNDGWYTGWFAAWGVRQHLNLAVFRCVEHDRPMIRCANTGISCEVDQDGTVVDRLRSADSKAYIDVVGNFFAEAGILPGARDVFRALGKLDHLALRAGWRHADRSIFRDALF